MERKLTLVCGNAGYGKTTMALEFRQEAGIRFEWHHCTPVDRDAIRATEVLDACICSLGSGTTSGAMKRNRLRGQRVPDVEVLCETLLRRAVAIGDELALIVLDDYSVLDQAEEANALIGSFIEKAPPNLHFLLLCRTVPALSVARLKAGRELSAIGEDDLRLTLDETRQLLQSEIRLELTDSEVELIHGRTEGWAAGVAMVSQSLWV